MSISVRAIPETETLRFIKSQWNFYKNDPHWAPPLIMDRQKLLNTKKNPFYQHGSIQLFLAERNGEVVGRIAGIINRNHNTTHNDKADSSDSSKASTIRKLPQRCCAQQKSG